MKSVASAPCKTILFGEHFVMYDTSAILCAIDKRITVRCETIKEKDLKIKSNIGTITTSLDDSIDNKFKPLLYIVKHVLKINGFEGGVSMDIDSSIPAGVGLGSSSACFVAAARAVLNLFDKSSIQKVIDLAVQAEKTIFSSVSGADTTISAIGGIIDYDKTHTKIDSRLNFSLVIANSNETHSTNDVVNHVAEFAKQDATKFSNLCKREAKIIQEAKNGIIDADIHKVGRCMSENQECLQEIGVSNDTLDHMIRLAEQRSYGAKITGAGKGGCIIAITDQTNVRQTMEILEKNSFECFSTKITTKGLDNI